MTVFGTVSLLADFVYEGARSITGPLLASLGATGLAVGVVTGIGEAAALGLRLVSGPLTDRTQRFWAWTIAGYALTIVTVAASRWESAKRTLETADAGRNPHWLSPPKTRPASLPPPKE